MRTKESKDLVDERRRWPLDKFIILSESFWKLDNM